MIDRRELLTAAANLGLLPNIVEKDYVLGWVLAGIFRHPALADKWIFKGGTCLKKCYFETYRFSEDLDFTLTDESQLNVDFLVGTFREVSHWIYDQTGIELPADKITFEVFQNPRNRPAGQGRISYRGPIAPTSGDLPRIKLDLAADEILVLPPVDRPVSHPYSDAPDGGITARSYCYEEVFAEKIRALSERARPRDLYDVINLFRHDDFKPAAQEIHDVLSKKCTFKGIPFPTVPALSQLREELQADWTVMLAHQLPSLPPVNAFWNQLPELFAWIEEGHRPAVPASFPVSSGDTVIRPPAGAISIPGMASSAPIEVIRFAASNRLCVELDYVDDQGNRATRIIEPYSLRRTQAGDIVLHAIRSDNQQHRSYRIDRIQGARATQQLFLPRYAIELTPTGPIPVPPASRVPQIATFRPARTRISGRSRPTYVYECTRCGKHFEHSERNPTLRAHKDKGGWRCSGRHGIFVDTKW
ncbi:MAG: nucleotidyl transferase AbiEii/AbiGii toxin family protein [Acidobacteriia bacterium]|nr:nucleotidyl transferase AbiEii/AbiGii toxin family protein [Terriglobia bacterium]